MSDALDKLTGHFNKQIANNLQEGYLEELDLKFWFYPTYSFRDNQKVMELSGQGKIVESLVETVLVKARNEDGSKMFGPAARVRLMNEVDPKIIIKMAGIINDADISDEEIEKN